MLNLLGGTVYQATEHNCSVITTINFSSLSFDHRSLVLRFDGFTLPKIFWQNLLPKALDLYKSSSDPSIPTYREQSASQSDLHIFPHIRYQNVRDVSIAAPLKW